MRAGQLPIDEQDAYFRQVLRRNRTLTEVLTRAAAMGLPGWYLVAGCLYQTVWNVVTGQPPEAGILDYDLAYCDASDLSWDAEDAVIRAGNQVFAGLPAPVQIRNQARVHLWYEPKFGIRALRTSARRRRSTPTRRQPPASASVKRPTGGGGSTSRTACRTCSTSWCGPTRSSRPATCTRPRPPAGAGSGRG
jgi:Nucleotidyltransferase